MVCALRVIYVHVRVVEAIGHSDRRRANKINDAGWVGRRRRRRALGDANDLIV